jgi:phosphoserine phosphatase
MLAVVHTDQVMRHGACWMMLSQRPDRMNRSPTIEEARTSEPRGGNVVNPENPLPTWRDGAAKAAVLEFVSSVTEPGRSFVAPPERIAAFDNDGTLWCEKPLYVQADFLFRRWRQMVDEDPARAEEQPWKAVVEGDQTWLAGLTQHLPELLKGVTEAYDAITADAFEHAVRQFFSDAKHPTLDVPYTQIGYRPMRELISLLEAHEFTVYICSAGGRDFVRAVAEDMYGVPRERVIGSASTLEYRDGDLYRTRGVEQPIDDGPGKPVHVWTRTGRKPLVAGGNADGDVAMLETAQFGLLVHHDDAEREFAYDTGAEQALTEAAIHGWTLVSMKNDFATIF